MRISVSNMYEILWSEFELWMLLQSRPSSNFLQAAVSNLRPESEMDAAVDLKTDIFVIRSELKKTLTFFKK